jgi:DNA-binding response OmpR family regulator
MVNSESVRILVIEDEVKLATHLSRALETEGHEARVVHDGRVALVEARDGNYDLLVLDVELPRLDGFEILKQLRSCGAATRILMLTARSENPDKIAGLMGGADDYLTKPFAMNELLARVNALGRRFAAPPSRILRAGDVTLNVEKREVWRGERRIELSERECALLKVLMREPGRAFSRMELSERVWERAHDYDTKLIEIYIGRLRKKIDEGSSQPLIKTVRHLATRYRAIVQHETLFASLEAGDMGGAICFQRLGYLLMDDVDSRACPGIAGARSTVVNRCKGAVSGYRKFPRH